MKNLLKNLWLTSLIFIGLGLSACDKNDDPVLTNNLVGTWRLENADNFWVEFTFNENLTGIREDSDGEFNEFNYTFTATQFTITNGPFTGNYDYQIVNNILTIDNEDFTKL